MGIVITCDKCGEEIESDFVRLRSDFCTVNGKPEDIDPVSFCAVVDEFIMCQKCYDKLWATGVM